MCYSYEVRMIATVQVEVVKAYVHYLSYREQVLADYDDDR
nr:MAG TPA: hypothetical protein [Caudoviricetes sp.]